MSKSKINTGTSKAKRLSFPDDEKKHSWLGLLLDAYFIVDKGIAKAIEEEKKKGRKLACAQGCSSCCRTHKDIPVYPLELICISWYATGKVTGAVREALKKQLEGYKKNGPCPFLIEGACSIHPMRPMACRQFNVFGKPCEEGEDPFYSRREDVMNPVKKHVDQAFYIMLPFYGIEKESERIKVVESGSFHKLVKDLHACNWKTLAKTMLEFDVKKQEEG
ncbi:MAG: YkgJ family cysteine cluster protein [Nitrospirae bacterium]|nr:YkgJ family cysteine cluster protein [Nitrospirota bacterium]